MKNFAKLLAILSICVLFTGCDKDDKVKVEPLKVGVTIVFPPFGFRDEENRLYQGFDIDLIRAIGRELNRPIRTIGISFDGLVPSIQTEDIDIAISAITINDERKQYLIFSEPYFESGLQIVVREDNFTIKSVNDLKGKRIAVHLGTTSDLEAQKIEGAILTRFPTPAECFDELEIGNVDAVINDRPVNEYMLAQGQIKNVKILPELLTHEEYGIATTPDKVELMQQINSALQKIRESGEYYQIYSKWFGSYY